MRKAVMGDFFNLVDPTNIGAEFWNGWKNTKADPPWENWHNWTYPGWNYYLKQLCIELGVGVGSG